MFLNCDINENCEVLTLLQFWTRNTRKPIKGSKDPDFNLISNKNLSKIFLSSGWAQGQIILAKSLVHLWCHSQKARNPKPKIFFHYWFEDLPHLWTAIWRNRQRRYGVANKLTELEVKYSIPTFQKFLTP